MSEIVKRIRSANIIRGNRLFEADEDDIYDEDEGPTPIEDDEPEDEFEGEDEPTEDTEEDMPEEEEDSPAMNHAAGSRRSPSFEDSESGDEADGAEEEEAPEAPTPPSPKSNNPLDNNYAISFQLGDTVSLAASAGQEDQKKGTIEGYDKDGFYRILWDDGATTSGITDTALMKLSDEVRESKCICGGKKFVNENNVIVCDNCGRKLKGKRGKIYAAPPKHITTAVKPNISETIKKSLKSRLHEEDKDDIKSPTKMYLSIHRLQGEFWSTIDAMIRDIKSLGYEVTYQDEDMVEIHADNEQYDMMIPISGTARTKMLDFKKAKLLK